MSNGSSQTYRLSAGCGDEHHLTEINALAGQGYRIAHMLYVPSGEKDNKPIVVLMQLTHAPEDQGYSR